MIDYTELKSAIEYILNQGALEREFIEDADLLDAAWAVYDALGPTDILALIAENDRIKSDNREMLKFKEHMVELRETHGFDSWAAALVEVDRLKAENEALRKRIDDMSPFKGAPLTGQDTKCLACGGYHYGMGGLPCPNMRVTAQTDLPETRSGQIGGAMGKGEQS